MGSEPGGGSLRDAGARDDGPRPRHLAAAETGNGGRDAVVDADNTIVALSTAAPSTTKHSRDNSGSKKDGEDVVDDRSTEIEVISSRDLDGTRSNDTEIMPAGSRKRTAHRSRGSEGSSTDEEAPIIPKSHGQTQNYQSISPSIPTKSTSADSTATERDRQSRAEDGARRHEQRNAQQAAANVERSEQRRWRKWLERYGSVELENKGSVARDHLALERTFLAWLRTSLSFASIGIAITQLFRLNTTISKSVSGDTPQSRLRHVGKPLGAVFIAIAILVLFIGFHRYFEAQHYVIRGKFPASRGSIMVVAAVAGALIISSLVVILAVAPGAFES